VTYPQAIQFLHGLQMFGFQPGLETPRKLAALAGNPQDHLRFIHVAGTNGKGSTCAFLESIYRAAGLRVGLFTSPHLVSFRERIQTGRRLIPEPEVARLVEELRGVIGGDPEAARLQPTFFEFVTVMALQWFAEQHCDLVIWETGLGGRLDATNIVTPLASVITNIAFDHTQWLGDTLAKIAAEKAGIIKPGVPVITAVDAAEALEVIRRRAAELAAPLTVVDAAAANAPGSWHPLTLGLRGDHQRSNAALAVATTRVLQPVLPVSESAIKQGLETVRWPGRFQVERTAGGPTFVFDGAHNPAGAATLRAALAGEFPGQRPALVIGVLADKDWREIVRALAPLAAQIWAVPVNSRRTLAPDTLAAACRELNAGAEVQACPALADALQHCATAPLVVVTGSLYLVGEALERLGFAEGARGERDLNEWSAPAKKQPPP
jgi:dihydrofolate synthase/folylpolyglutamate synthase